MGAQSFLSSWLYLNLANTGHLKLSSVFDLICLTLKLKTGIRYDAI